MILVLEVNRAFAGVEILHCRPQKPRFVQDDNSRFGFFLEGIPRGRRKAAPTGDWAVRQSEMGFNFGENPRAQSRVTVPPKAGLKKGLDGPSRLRIRIKQTPLRGLGQVHDTRRDCKVVHLFLCKK